MFIHDPDEIEPTLVVDGTLEGLEEARDRGWIDFLGYGMRPHDFHLAVIESGRTDALLTFNDFNLLRQTSTEDIIPAAAEKGLGVINGWSIMRGWLTGKPVDSFIPRESGMKTTIGQTPCDCGAKNATSAFSRSPSSFAFETTVCRETRLGV